MFWTSRRGGDPAPPPEADPRRTPDATWELSRDSGRNAAWDAMQDRVRERARLRARHHRLSPEDAEDVAGEACLRMLRLLDSPQLSRVRDVDRYLNRLVDNLCKAQIRSQRPVWTRLKAEIVETLRGKRSARGFALWRVNGIEMAGYAQWEGRDVTCTPAYLRLLEGECPPFARRSGKRGDLPQALADLFDWAGSPLPLNEVVSLAFEITGLLEHRPEEGGLWDVDLPARRDVEADTLRALLIQDIAHALLSLPPDEAAAFVFHLPGEVAERLCLALSPGGIERLAGCIHICPRELEDALDTLPWSDLRIAAFLCLEHGSDKVIQQGVINRRQRALRALRRALEETDDAR